jgi:LppP/LprE lipoprotein
VRELLSRTWPQNLPIDDPRPHKISRRRRPRVIFVAAVLAVGGLGAVLTVRGASTSAHEPIAVTDVSANPPRPTAITTTVPPTTATTLSATAVRTAAESLVTQLGYTPQAEGPFDQDTEFTVILAVMQTNEHPFRAFLYVHGAFVGWDAPESSKGVTLLGADGTTVTLRYDLYRKGDRNCCPSGGRAAVRFQWDGTKIVGLDPIPSTDVRNNLVP